MTLPSLVIFDCDGVLVDSEMIASRVLANYLTELGFPLSAADCRARFTGMSIASVKTMVEGNLDAPLADDFEDELRTRDRSVFEKELESVPGIEPVLQDLSISFCIASSGSPLKIANSLRITGLDRFFDDNIFSATQVANGKPAPDLFLFAAEKMQTSPEQTVVIEDSPLGVIAAERAGMRVFGFCGGSHAKDEPGYADKLLQAGAEQVFDDMRALGNLF